MVLPSGLDFSEALRKTSKVDSDMTLVLRLLGSLGLQTGQRRIWVDRRFKGGFG